MKTMILALASLLGIGLLGAGSLMIAIKRNGPAVLDTIDRLAGPRNDVELVERVNYAAHPNQKLRVYRSAAAVGPLPVVVFFHGGSWANGDPDDYGFIARNIAAQGFLVVLGGYRMNGPGRYPAMLEDTAAVVGWVHRSIARHGGDPDRIVLAGHSAGAYNAVQVALERRWLVEAGVPPGAVRAVVGLSGPYDFYPFDTKFSRATFASVGAGPESQPVNHARPDAPPMLLVHETGDTVVRIRNSRALARALEAKGAPVEALYLPGKSHNYPLLALAHPWRRDPLVFDRLIGFLRDNAQLSVPVQAGKQ